MSDEWTMRFDTYIDEQGEEHIKRTFVQNLITNPLEKIYLNRSIHLKPRALNLKVDEIDENNHQPKNISENISENLYE
jgi:hypothetical protein